MRVWTLTELERAQFGHSHVVEITADDLTVTTVTTGQTLTPGITFAAGSFVSRCSWYLKTSFQNTADAASLTTTFAVGETVGSTTSLMAATQANTNGTVVVNQTDVPHVGTPGTPVTGFTAATNLIITVGTPTTGKKLSDINAGILYIYLCVHDPRLFVAGVSYGPYQTK